MVLDKLKKIRDELKESATSYDEAFKNTALIATESLMTQQQLLDAELNKSKPSYNTNKKTLVSTLNKEYFLERYGSLKKAKEAYKQIYGQKKYGKSWQEFLTVANELPLIQQPMLTLEARVEKIENILKSMGYKI